MKTYLITGGCGFIGVNLVRYLQKEEPAARLRVLDDLSVGTRESLAQVCDFVEPGADSSDASHSSPVQLMVGDVRDKDRCLEACRGINAVVHLAAHAGVIPSIEDPYTDFEINVLGTLNMLYAAKERGVEKFILASSNAPLGSQEPPMNEKRVPRPLSPYGAGKLACEAYCSAFYGSYGLKTVALRFSNVYGPHSLHKESVVAKFIKDALTGGVLTIYGDGTQTRDFIHVEDVCYAIHLLLKASPSSPTFRNIWGRAFHLGTGVETHIIDLAKQVAGLCGGDIKIVFKPERRGEIKRNYSDITEAERLFSFKPKVPLGDGLERVYGWFLSQGVESIKGARVLSGSD